MPTRCWRRCSCTSAVCQLEDSAKQDAITVTVLPKHLDEEVAAPVVAGFGGVLTELTPTQADYINVPVAGPFKNDSYKY